MKNSPEVAACDHGVRFPTTPEGRGAVLRHMSVEEIRKCFPRHFGTCKSCGFQGIYYASKAHYVAGDW